MNQETIAGVEKLRAFLIAKEWKQSDLARVLTAAGYPIKHRAISFWFTKFEIPVERAIQIEEATNGEITAHDMRPDLYPVPWGEKPEWIQAAA